MALPILSFVSCFTFCRFVPKSTRLCRKRIVLSTLQPPNKTTAASTNTPPTSQTASIPDTPSPPTLTRLAASATFLLYVYSTFSFSANATAESARSLTVGLVEALQLSINFAFVTPILFPSIAPVFTPTYEALFNIVVAWAFLFSGFLSEDLSKRQIVPYTLVAKATLFVTNFAYLPFIVFRRPNPSLVQPIESPSLLQRVSESRWLPAGSAALAIASLAWAVLGRDTGDMAMRFNEFKILLQTDVLAHSLGLDCLALTAFQSVLVDDDAKRRGWDGVERDTAVRVARFVPLFGLAYYLWRRAECAPLIRR